MVLDRTIGWDAQEKLVSPTGVTTVTQLHEASWFSHTVFGIAISCSIPLLFLCLLLLEGGCEDPVFGLHHSSIAEAVVDGVS